MRQQQVLTFVLLLAGCQAFWQQLAEFSETQLKDALTISDAKELKSYMASLQAKDGDGNYRHFCGAAIIGEQYLITAAHCNVNMDDVTALSGVYRLSEAPLGQRQRVKKFINHPDYSGGSNDIALVVLEAPYQFSRNVSALPIFVDPLPRDGSYMSYGWGYYHQIAGVGSEFTVPDQLQAKEGTLIPNDECAQTYSITEKDICLQNNLGRAACSGDSGSPAIVQTPQGDQMVGTVSRGFLICGARETVFTYVAPYEEWINEQIRLNSN